MDKTDFVQFIKGRRSVRSYRNEPVAEADLVEAIELATWAPNAMNQQNWQFIIIFDKAVIAKISEAQKAVFQEITGWPEVANVMPKPPAGSPPPKRPDTLGEAAAVIAVATKRVTNALDEGIMKRAATDVRAKQVIDGVTTAAGRIQSVASAVAYLQLALYQKGLGSVWMTGPVLAKAEIEKILGLSEDYDFVALVPVGYPAETPTKDRKPVSEVIKVIK